MSDRDSALGALVERPRPTILAAAAVSLLAIAGLWIVSLLISRMPLSDQTAREFLFSAMYYLPFVALPIALYALRRPGLSGDLCIRSGHPFRGNESGRSRRNDHPRRAL